MATPAILYTNDKSRNDLAMCETPDRTDTWTPVPHILVVEQIEKQLAQLGYGVIAEGYSLLGDNNEDMWGTFRLGKITHYDAGNCGYNRLIQATDEYGLSVGFKNSNRKKFRLTIGAGANVTVCSNGMFVAEMVAAHKHSKFLMDKMGSTINDALTHLLSLSCQIDQRIEFYKETQMSRSERNDFIVTAFEQSIIPSSFMGNILDEIAQPRHKEFSNDNLWGVYNCCTEVFKKSLNQLQSRTLGLTELADSLYQFQPALSA